MKFSVIIPTYNDAPVLEKCLEHLQSLDYKEYFEVIVVDDGSTDNTQELLEKWSNKETLFQLKTIKQKNKKQGAARNAGAKIASGDVFIFIGADILVSKRWLKEHTLFHEAFPDEKYIGLGYMTWSPDLADNRFRKWLESSGTILSYKGLKNYHPTDYWHFYTGNISLKKTLFEKHYFDESFTHYGWEDIMLGYEMTKNAAEIFYTEKASAWHHHALTEKDFFPNRMREIGKSAVLFQKKYPEVGIVPKGIKRFVFRLLSFDVIIAFLSKIKKEWEWYAKSKKYFLEGINNATL